MTHSATPSQYVIQPRSYPDFLFKRHARTFKELISWAEEEYAARLKYCADHGYFKQHAYLTRNSSPVRVLAELSGFRRVCSLITQSVWDQLSRHERRVVVGAFEMREFLMKS